jgi:hypothetical protein
MFLDRHRNLEIGANVRAGVDLNGDAAAFITAHIAYLWSAW